MRRAPTPKATRATEVGRARDSLDLAARTARQLEDLLGRRRQDSIERRITIEGDLLQDVEALCEAAATARDATGKRADVARGQDAQRVRVRRDDRRPARMLAPGRRDPGPPADRGRGSDAGRGARRAPARPLATRPQASSSGSPRRSAARSLRRTSRSTETERTEIDAKLERLARRREALGPVNPLAEREYEEARTYVQELEEQRTDLEAAMKELEGLIAETDRKITADFEETFEAARKNFEELIEHLFPGGRGRLRLVTERTPKPVIGGGEAPAAEGEAPDDDPDEEAQSDFEGHGVEIEVTPAGKAMRKLQLLSGGEKSLVALAFVFSVFMARPSPFYILDEVEAALDDANIDRFLQLVRRFSDRAQFIVVTHQKRTMDAADVLYGVSMARGGITKVVSRRMPEAAEQPSLEAADAA